MEWTRDLVLEFIELLQREPVLWNIKDKNHKNRNIGSAAWNRVKNDFSVPFTIGELKKKKNSLFTQYRDYLRRLKDATKSNESYEPSWFAFNLMNSFLGEMYDKSLLDSEEVENNFLFESATYIESDENTNELISQESDSSNKESNSYKSAVRKRRHGMQDLSFTKSELDESYLFIKERPVKRKYNREDNEMDECDMYVKLLAQKLKKLDEEDRLSLMNDIDNLAFKYIMEAKSRNRKV